MNKIILTIALLFIFLQFESYSQFTAAGGPVGAGKINCIYTTGNDIYAGTQTGGVYKAVNNSTTWAQINNGLGNLTINCMKGINNTVLAGTENGFFRTTDGGASWTAVNYGITHAVSSITVNGSDFYLGTVSGKIYKSVNNGANWTLFADNLTGQLTTILFHNGIIYAAANSSGVYASSNNGANWTFESVGYYIKVLYPTGNVIRLGTGNGGKKNTNPMGGWVQDIPWINYVLGYASVGNYIIAGMSTGMFWSSDNGVTWNDPNSFFMAGYYIFSMAQNNEYVLAGTQNGGIFRRPVSELTGLTNISSTLPENYFLSQNYPNPFNPATNIRFGLQKSSEVILNVYNQLGQSVAELVKQNLEAGEYEYYFDASALSSGIYYYRLTTDDVSITKKMILIK